MSKESATALWDGAARDVRAPGRPAWTSALDTERSWQTPEHAAAIPTGPARTAPQVSAPLCTHWQHSFSQVTAESALITKQKKKSMPSQKVLYR